MAKTIAGRFHAIWLTRVQGHRIGKGARIARSARLVSSSRGSIEVGDGALIGPLVLICAESPNGGSARIRIGAGCQIGGNSLIGPGVALGNGALVEAGSVVLVDVPGGAIVSGNPANIVGKVSGVKVVK